MSQPWILITPASRGLGHALARHLLRTTTAPILATARRDPDAVRSSLLHDDDDGPPLLPGAADRLHVVPLDVTDEASLRAASDRAAALFPPDRHHLRLALAAPGVLLRAEKSLAQVDAADALATYRVNALGPLLLMKWFGGFLPRRGTARFAGPAPVPLSLPDHAVWAAVSARVGSVSDNRAGGWYSYRSSKAAVNSITKSFDLSLVARSGERAMAVAYHPGTVKTDLSRDYWATVPKEKLFTPEYAAEKMIEVVTRKVGLEGRGRCWDWKGEEILP